MSLIGRLEEELREATLARNAERRDTLRLILNSLRGAEKAPASLKDEEELQVLQRERKRRQEAAEAFREGAAARSRRRRRSASSPCSRSSCRHQLGDEDLEEIIDDVIAEVGATACAISGE